VRAETSEQQIAAQTTMEEPDSAAAARAGASASPESTSLLADADVAACRGRWDEIQTSFVDRPREAVEQADALVEDLMRRLTSGFTQQRSRLEEQWGRGDDVSTEDLRVALTRYRAFFNRLLAA